MVLINLFFEVILDPLLQCFHISDSLFSDSLQLEIQIMKAFPLSHKLVLVLTVCVAELHQLRDVIGEHIHLILSAVQVVLLSAIDIIKLMLVSLD